MIEKMITEVKQYVPLKITEITWDATILQMHGPGWNFTTLSAWRVSTNNKIVFGCYDKDSMELMSGLKNTEILEMGFQTSFLKVDPVFFLSNGQKIEIFSTDTYEPWSLYLKELGAFIPTPTEPDIFYK